MTRPEFQCDLEMTGVLLENGEARMRQIDAEGHLVPCLCLELESEGPTRNRVHLEQPFPPGHDNQCRAAAHRYKRGMRVTFRAPTVGVQLVARNVHHLHVHQAETAAASSNAEAAAA